MQNLILFTPPQRAGKRHFIQLANTACPKPFICFAIVFAQFILFPLYAQGSISEKLRIFESGVSAPYQIQLTAKATNPRTIQPQNDAAMLARSLDSLLVFIASQKNDPLATFSQNILPYLDDKVYDRPFGSGYSQDEEAVFESFLKRFQWQHAQVLIAVYRDFVLVNHKQMESFQSILAVFDYINAVFDYTNKQHMDDAKKAVIQKLAAQFSEYNHIDWFVFSRQPRALVLWLAATYAWDTPN